MADIKKDLYDLIAKVQQLDMPNKVQICNEIGDIAIRYYAGDKGYTANVTNLLKGRLAILQEVKAPVGSLANSNGAESKWSNEWTGGKPKNTGQTSIEVAPAVEIEELAPEDQNEASDKSNKWPDVQSLVGLNGQQLLDTFQNTKRMKDFTKELAWPIDRRLNATSFIEAFEQYVNHHYGEGDVSEEE